MSRPWFGPRRRRRSYLPQLQPLEDRALPAITMQFDFTHDTSGFFSVPSHLLALQTAASTLTSRLGDTLSAIVPDQTAGNTWRAKFTDPATGVDGFVDNLTVPANTLIVFAGGRTLSPGGLELGEGGPGGFDVKGTQAFVDTVSGRGQAGALTTPATDFGPWGGSAVFDSGANWYFGLDPNGLQPGQVDFLSVAEHELSHLLGFGIAPSWKQLDVGGHFVGPAATAEFGGTNPPTEPPPDAGHWADGLLDHGARATMDPILPDGTRATFTPLDFAGLQDMGWQILPASAQANQPPIAVDVNLPSIATNSPAVTIPASSILSKDQPGPPSESGQNITITAVNNAVGGTVTLVNGNPVFTPAANFTGNASFMYTITDDGLTNGLPDPKSNSATAHIAIGTPPVANDATAMVPAGAQAFPITVTASDPTNGTLTLTGTSTAQHGTAGISNGVVVYTPAAGFTGSDSFTYTVTSSSGLNAVGNVKVTVNPATVAPSFPASVSQGSSVAVNILASAFDPIGLPLTISAVSGAGHGTTTIAGGNVVYMPLPGFSGADSFTYQVNDGEGGTAQGTVTVMVNPLPATTTTTTVVPSGGSTPTGGTTSSSGGSSSGSTRTPTLTVVVPKQVKTTSAVASLRGKVQLSGPDAGTALVVHVTTNHGQLRVSKGKAKVSGLNSHALTLKGTTGAVIQALKSLTLLGSSGSGPAHVTVSASAGSASGSGAFTVMFV